MNLGLYRKRYLAAGEYTIADIICYPWAAGWKLRQVDIEEFPNVKRWLGEIGEWPAVQKAMAAVRNITKTRTPCRNRKMRSASSCWSTSAPFRSRRIGLKLNERLRASGAGWPRPASCGEGASPDQIVLGETLDVLGFHLALDGAQMVNWVHVDPLHIQQRC